MIVRFLLNNNVVQSNEGCRTSSMDLGADPSGPRPPTAAPQIETISAYLNDRPPTCWLREYRLWNLPKQQTIIVWRGDYFLACILMKNSCWWSSLKSKKYLVSFWNKGKYLLKDKSQAIIMACKSITTNNTTFVQNYRL